jgi:hypothetical protein
MVVQCRFSQSVKFFQQGFMDRWNLRYYFSAHQPAIFVGVYRPEDVDIINNHRGFKIVANTGKLRDIFWNINPTDTFVTGIMGGVMDPEREKLFDTYTFIETSFPIKDFSTFKPTPLGSSIYCYLGNESGKHIMGYDLIEQIRKRTNFDIIIGMQGHSMDYVKENFYNKCFINIKPSITGGLTGACELAYMGRRTVSNAKAPFCLPYNSIDDILRIIDQESSKIGTLQPSCINRFFTTGEEWKHLRFWLSAMVS